MCFKKKKKAKTVSVFTSNKPFVVACSEYAFEEADKQYPDLSFFEDNGLHWCVRIGDISIPWGLGADSFGASGVLNVARHNVNDSSFDRRGYRDYKTCGDVRYLFLSDFDGNDFYGFTIALRDRINPIIRDLAKGLSREEFEALAADGKKMEAAFASILEENSLSFKGFVISSIESKN